MKIEKFEDLTFWKESVELSGEILRMSAGISSETLKNSLVESSLSISWAIAQWFERRFWPNEFKNWLYDAKWSNSELRSLLHIWKEMWYISEDDFDKAQEKSLQISKMIWGFLKTLTPEKQAV